MKETKRVYVAAPWVLRDAARSMAERLEQVDCSITWDWWNHEADELDVVTLSRLAQKDFNGVISADLMILLNYEKSEGKAVEQGIARSFYVPIWGVGPHPTNIFQNDSRLYRWFESEEALLEAINRE